MDEVRPKATGVAPPKAIALTHRTRIQVNDQHMVRGRGSVKVAADPKNKKTQDVWLRKGVPLIAHRRWEKHGIHNSTRAIVLKVNSSTVTVRLGGSGKEVEMPTEDFHRILLVAYCVTIHKSQCMTIDTRYSIYDWEHRMMNWRAKYVAVSRATRLDLITVSK